jgi:uncharacterized protein
MKLNYSQGIVVMISMLMLVFVSNSTLAMYRNGDTDNQSLLSDVWNNRINDVTAHLDRGTDVNYVDSSGNSILGYAASEIAVDAMASLLIRRGANVNHVNNLGATVLYLAVAKNRTAAVVQLIEHGANINRANNEGITPL